MVDNHGDCKSPIPGVVGPLPNGRTPWLINGGDPNWDDTAEKTCIFPWVCLGGVQTQNF